MIFGVASCWDVVYLPWMLGCQLGLGTTFIPLPVEYILYWYIPGRMKKRGILYPATPSTLLPVDTW